MFPYLAMLAFPSLLALTPAGRRAGFLLVVVVAVYWLMIAFRFRVGMDWFNYVDIYRRQQSIAWTSIAERREPGFLLLSRFAGQFRNGLVVVNAISGLVFIVGLAAVARRCQEPMLAIVVATPLLVVGLAMSGVRQAIALGFIFLLFAKWERYSTPKRFLMVFVASLFHFSSIFVLIYVALASRAPLIFRVGATLLVAVVVFAVVRIAPQSVEAYSRLYVGEERQNAPGAVMQIAPLALAALAYLLARRRWAMVYGHDPLQRNLAWSALAAMLMIPISSVGAYRFALYFWPMAMSIWSGFPALIENTNGRAFYRLLVVLTSYAALIGWLLFANNSHAWLPYQSWLLNPSGTLMWFPHH